MRSSAQLKRGADRIRATARGHVFLAGGEKSRAHRGRIFAAAAAAVALLEIADKRFVLEGEGEFGLKGSFNS